VLFVKNSNISKNKVSEVLKLMTEKKLKTLYSERARLLDAWRSANEVHKMSILTRIGDIDEQVAIIKENLASVAMQQKNKIHPGF